MFEPARHFAGRPLVRPVVPALLARELSNRPGLEPLPTANGLDPWLAPPPLDGALGPQAPRPAAEGARGASHQRARLAPPSP